jgi:hypothetical protein
LTEDSPAVDAGLSWGQPFNGAAPDLGAFESDWGSPGVANIHVFYNNSSFDGRDPAANAADDAAIAADKQPLMTGGTAGFANYISYQAGINGIMVDIAGMPGTPTASDFVIKVGNDSNPAGWEAGPTPTVNVREGAGSNGADRVSLTWPDGSIVNKWVQVAVLANEQTGLEENEVFYFGNAIGETGDSTSEAQVSPTDQIGVRANPHTLAENPAAVGVAHDFDRDGKVGPTDQVLCRNNGTNSETDLNLISVP